MLLSTTILQNHSTQKLFTSHKRLLSTLIHQRYPITLRLSQRNHNTQSLHPKGQLSIHTSTKPSQQLNPVHSRLKFVRNTTQHHTNNTNNIPNNTKLSPFTQILSQFHKTPHVRAHNHPKPEPPTSQPLSTPHATTITPLSPSPRHEIPGGTLAAVKRTWIKGSYLTLPLLAAVGVVTYFTLRFKAARFFHKTVPDQELFQQFIDENHLSERFPQAWDLEQSGEQLVTNEKLMLTMLLRNLIIYHQLLQLIPAAQLYCDQLQKKIQSSPHLSLNNTNDNNNSNIANLDELNQLIRAIRSEFDFHVDWREFRGPTAPPAVGELLFYLSEPDSPTKCPILYRRWWRRYGIGDKKIGQGVHKLNGNINQLKLALRNLESINLIINSICDPQWCSEYNHTFNPSGNLDNNVNVVDLLSIINYFNFAGLSYMSNTDNNNTNIDKNKDTNSITNENINSLDDITTTNNTNVLYNNNEKKNDRLTTFDITPNTIPNLIFELSIKYPNSITAPVNFIKSRMACINGLASIDQNISKTVKINNVVLTKAEYQYYKRIVTSGSGEKMQISSSTSPLSSSLSSQGNNDNINSNNNNNTRIIDLTLLPTTLLGADTTRQLLHPTQFINTNDYFISRHFKVNLLPTFWTLLPLDSYNTSVYSPFITSKLSNNNNNNDNNEKIYNCFKISKNQYDSIIRSRSNGTNTFILNIDYSPK